MHTVKGRHAAAIYEAMHDGSAVKVPAACFVDEGGETIMIDYYSVGRRVFRCEHDDRDVETYLEELDGDDLVLFKEIYHIH